MREVELLIGGIIVGLMIAVPVGPVNILCIHRTLGAGPRSGVISGLGAAAADMLYGVQRPPVSPLSSNSLYENSSGFAFSAAFCWSLLVSSTSSSDPSR